MRNRNAFTLVEILIASTLAAGVLYLLSQVFMHAMKGSAKLNSRVNSGSSILAMGGHLQKFMGTGDTRFFAFSGRGALGDRTLARLFIPLPGRCADVADLQNCPEDTALLYVHYDKTSSPAVTAICSLDNQTLLVDTNNITYGPSQFVNDGFDIACVANSPIPCGKVPISANTLLAVSNPPLAVVWVTQANPVFYALNYDPNTKTFTPSIPADCQRNLQPDPADAARYLLNGLHKVTISPYVLTQFTGGNAVSATELATNLGPFPARVFALTLRSTGKGIQNGTGTAEVRNCDYNLGVVNCPGNALLQVSDVKTVRLDESFKLRLGATIRDRFEIKLDAMAVSASCLEPNCAVLPLADPAAMTVAWNNTENYENLSDAGFSLFKQESLSRIRFRLLTEIREDYFDVFFP